MPRVLFTHAVTDVDHWASKHGLIEPVALLIEND